MAHTYRFLNMSLHVGQQLGSFDITMLLGKGGMGEVYRARDTKLKREVAIKILPAEFSRDPERVSRFQREAEALAALNHPNIGAIYDLQQVDGICFLILELIEGDTLADLLAKRGALPVEEALNIAEQICEAVEAAHEKGVVHRDLKPANVKISPDGKVKVLDFGLAKAMENAPSSAVLSQSPTMVSATMGGVILGTAAYMSPEQARGFSADARSDIFSFGCVLYEMLTGRQTFQGDTVSDVLASVLKTEPDMSRLPDNLNPKIPHLLRRALEKNPKSRWHCVGDLRAELEMILAEPVALVIDAPAVVSKPLWKRIVPPVAVMVLTVLIALAVWILRPSPALNIIRFSIPVPEGQRYTNAGRHLITISPDGMNLVYVANGQLYLRSMADSEIRPIKGSAASDSSRGVTTPFFSPDGQWVGFFDAADRTLKKIRITGGAPVAICDIDNPVGASWSSDGRIFVGQGPKGIVRVADNGGKPQSVVTVQSGEVAQSPQLLPGSDFLLFTLSSGTGPDRRDKAQIVVQSLKTGERKIVFEGGSDARYVSTGHILYTLGSTVFAFPFDIKKLRPTSGPVQILDGVMRPGLGGTGAAQFSVSQNGTLVHIPSDAPDVGTTDIIALYDREGIRKPLNLPPGKYNHPRIEPKHGKQLAVEVFDEDGENIWIYDLTGTASGRRLTFGGRNNWPVWTPDGQRIVFASDREGVISLFWQRADGRGPAERLWKAEPGQNLQPESWSPDGKVLIFRTDGDKSRSRTWMLIPGSGQMPKLLIEDPRRTAANSDFSPDGHWIAYGSTDTAGRRQVYVQPFPPTEEKYQISTMGTNNHHPVWSPNGKQLFYWADRGIGTGQIISVDIQIEPSFIIGKTTPLPIEGIAAGPRNYDVTPDGKAFIVVLLSDQDEVGKAGVARATTPYSRAPRPINVVVNWFYELHQRVPLK